MEEISKEIKKELSREIEPEAPFKEPLSPQQAVTRIWIMVVVILLFLIYARFFTGDDSGNSEQSPATSENGSVDFDSLPGASGQ
jgi:hypothetical protein